MPIRATMVLLKFTAPRCCRADLTAPSTRLFVASAALLVAWLLMTPSDAQARQYIVALKPGGGGQLARDVARSSYVTSFRRVAGDGRLATVHVRSRSAGVLRRLRNHPDVLFVEPDLYRKLSWRPNDPSFTTSGKSKKGQWHLPRIRAHYAWNINDHGFTGQGATIAIIDSGVDSTHPDLRGKVLRGFNPAVPRKAGSKLRHNTEDLLGHGTHVAGIAAATASNRRGGVGVAPQARILPVKVDVNGLEGIRASDVAGAIRWATNHGADVINLSLGGEGMTKAEARALEYAARRGVVAVCASGNLGTGKIDYPARHPKCLAVGASNRTDKRAGFSNFGKGLDLVAPGVGVLSSVPQGGGYARFDGTSMAAPVVSGTAALLAARGLKRRKIVQVLRRTAKDLGRRGWDRKTGYGRVDAYNALRATRWKGYKVNSRPNCPAERQTISISVPDSRYVHIPMACTDRQDQQRLSYTFVDPSPTAGVEFRLATDHSYSGNIVIRRDPSRPNTSVQMRASDGKRVTPAWRLYLRAPTPKMTAKFARKHATNRIRAKFPRKRIDWGVRSCRRLGQSRARCEMEFLLANRLYVGTSMVDYRRTGSGTRTEHVFEGEWVTFACFFRNRSNCVRRVAFA